ncbi:GntR family transcriptional regulator [Brevibacillus sp. SYP-B805]|uniref:GntR family transcriptional regulator n=1 Tax=Brevibacillus sp. SYP-B805 TaxID=1578199 RepID=UPI0013EE0B92|nr:GntR family transcriptional regulator [Brevibacillus sp. SYP-B805]NGQ93972.1 GntR family transcriptional regulator [Brevibacillus sp. SYP-B805]
MTIRDFERNTKSDKVYEYLKEKILTGAYKPGERLVIREVSRQLGVSDIPVREAIKKLAADGLLELKSHSGARIAPLNIKNLEEIFLIRVELETLATRLAVNAATPEEIDQLDSYVQKMDDSIRRNDIAKYTKYNREFHRLLYRSSHSPILAEIIENLFVRSENSKLIFYHDPSRLRSSNEGHRAIVEAIRAKDEKKAAEIIRTQKEDGFKVVLNALRLSKTLLGG